MSFSQGQFQDRRHDQVRMRAQQRAQCMRQGLDDLDALESPGIDQGPEIEPEDLEPDDAVEGDLMDGPSETWWTVDSEAVSGAEDENVQLGKQKLPRLEDLIGRQRPLVLIRLERVDDAIKAYTIADVTSSVGVEALESLRHFVEQTFNTGLGKFNREQRDELLGSRKTSLSRRLVLLARLRVKLDSQTKSMTLARYGKYAILPDGTPFSLRLLFIDGRGKHNARAEGDDLEFDDVPPALVLAAVRSILRDEEAGRLRDADGCPFCDADLFLQILLRLKDWGLPIKRSRPEEWKKRMSRVRDFFKRNDIGHLLLNRSQRSRNYSHAEPVPDDLGEQSA